MTGLDLLHLLQVSGNIFWTCEIVPNLNPRKSLYPLKRPIFSWLKKKRAKKKKNKHKATEKEGKTRKRAKNIICVQVNFNIFSFTVDHLFIGACDVLTADSDFFVTCLFFGAVCILKNQVFSANFTHTLPACMQQKIIGLEYALKYYRIKRCLT